MKRIIILFFVLLCFACKKEKESLLDGACDTPIKLSPQKNLMFPPEGKMETITIDRDVWRIEQISLDDEKVLLDEKKDIVVDKEGNLVIKKEYFTIKQIASNKFTVKMEPNRVNKDRILVFIIQSGDCFSYLSVTQSGQGESS